MTDRELMQQALELIEDARNGSQRKPSEPVITALRERLAQPEQKPMHPELRKMWENYFDKCFRAQPEQEPVDK